MSRRETVYEERDTYIRDEAPRRTPVQVRERERERTREYEEVDVRRETREPDRRLDFLRDDYDRPSGELVRIERDTEVFTRPLERRPRSPSPVRYRERVIETQEPVERVRTRVVERERERERSPSPLGHLRARVIETRERIPVRQRSPSRERYHERIIERERSPSSALSERVRIVETREEIRRSPSPSSSPSPPPPIIRPPIHQEIITHHRHIDHGYEVELRVPTPPPPPRRSPVPHVRETDIDIHTSRNETEVDIHTKNRSHRHRSSSRGRIKLYDDMVLYEPGRDQLKVRDDELKITRRRSVSARPPGGYIGSASDWAIVDVPGTERLRIGGGGSSSEEITWRRHNGVRRSRFVPEVREDMLIVEPKRKTPGLDIDISASSSRRREKSVAYERVGQHSLPRSPLWTEITKDLVVPEAIKKLGYEFEETEYFYYVLKYLQYEDVLQIVQLSDQIRAERQARLQEIERQQARLARKEREEWEYAERMRARIPRPHYDGERIIEREVVYDARRPRRSGHW